MTLNATLARLIRFRENKITCTGGVVFIGDGNTGKTHTAMNLTSAKGKWYYQTGNDIRKSVNLELDYFIFQSHIEEYNLTTSSQIFIMPGQKGYAERGEGLAFEDAADLFLKAASINVVVALVLTYNVNDIKTFQELEYWLDRAIERDIIRKYTSIIILGTHLDQETEVQIDEAHLVGAKQFTHDYILEKQGLHVSPDQIHTLKLSNFSGEGLPDFKHLINESFMKAFNIESLITRLQT